MIEAIRQIKDPRWIVVFNHSILVTFGILASCVQRRWEQIVFAFLVGFSCDIVIGKLRNHNREKIFDQFISTTVIVLGLLVFLLSRHWWFYGAATFVALMAKAFIVRPNGQHAYNPTAFAIVSMVSMFPHHVFVRGDQYNGFLFPYLFVLFNGTLATIRVDRWRQTLSYITSSFITAIIITSFSSRHEFLRLFGPDFGVEGLLFMLLMFTDPKTSPRIHKIQIFAGFLIGILNVSFRAMEFAYSQFLAIFLVASFVAPFYDKIEIWKPGLGNWAPKVIRSLGLILVILALPISWIFKIESWPFTDYRMFSEPKRLQDVSVLHVYVDHSRLSLPGNYHGYHFLLDYLIRSKNDEYVTRLLFRLYQKHLQDGGPIGTEIIVKRIIKDQKPSDVFKLRLSNAT
jgi:Na+-translocating ferredoxin:NAD+ oxidoreductase RnfD subunit